MGFRSSQRRRLFGRKRIHRKNAINLMAHGHKPLELCQSCLPRRETTSGPALRGIARGLAHGADVQRHSETHSGEPVERIQWDNLCVRTDGNRENLHHGGILGTRASGHHPSGLPPGFCPLLLLFFPLVFFNLI